MSPATRSFQPVSLAFARLSEAEMRGHAEEFLALMSRRRSVPQFAPEPMPPELIEDALRVAGTAPSGANQQPWSFVMSPTRT